MPLMPIVQKISTGISAYKISSPVRFGSKIIVDSSVPDEFKQQIEAAKPKLEEIFPDRQGRRAILAFSYIQNRLMKDGIYRHIVILPSDVPDPSLENIKAGTISGSIASLIGRFYGIKDNRYNNIFDGFLEKVKDDLLYAQREYAVED